MNTIEKILEFFVDQEPDILLTVFPGQDANDIKQAIKDELKSNNGNGNGGSASPLLQDIATMSAEQLAKKYRIADADEAAKMLGTKRPKENGRNVKELAYWEHLKEVYKAPSESNRAAMEDFLTQRRVKYHDR